MVHIIVKRSERELRERAAESRTPGYRQGRNIDGYARGLEEADRIQRERGRDNPNQKPILVDEGSAQAQKRERDLAIQASGRKRENFE